MDQYLLGRLDLDGFVSERIRLEAAVLGAHIHACAGRMAGEGLAFGPTAEDVLDRLPQAAGRFMRRTS